MTDFLLQFQIIVDLDPSVIFYIADDVTRTALLLAQPMLVPS
jgi:hypothetical protein